MARCGCSGTTCSCKIEGGGLVDISGSGSAANPYVISVEQAITVQDTASVDMNIAGSGTAGDPYVLSAQATVGLGDIADVDLSNDTAGNVLAIQADGTLALVPPATAAPGAVNTGLGLEGDGSGGSPLAIKLAPNSGLTLDSNGLAASYTLMPPPVHSNVDADFLITDKTGGVSSRITGLTCSLTNPSTSTLLVKIEQDGWVQMDNDKIQESLTVYMSPDSVGGTYYMGNTGRERSLNPSGSIGNLGVYDDFVNWRYVILGPGETVTAYGRVWLPSTTSSDAVTKIRPLVRYSDLIVTALCAIDTTNLVIPS